MKSVARKWSASTDEAESRKSIMSKCEPEISVIIPCYNAERWIARAIDSVLGQEDVSAEVIVIDDGSTDKSLEVIRGFGDRIKWQTGANRGACAARNRGLALASTEYVMFLDADDYILPNTLKELHGDLVRSCASVAVGTVISEQSNGERHLIPGPCLQDRQSFIVSWLQGRWAPPCAVLWSTACVKNCGGWDEDLSKHQDAELMLRAAARGVKMVESNAAISIYNEVEASGRISQDFSERAVRDIILARQKLISEIKGTPLANRTVRLAIAFSLHQLEIHCLRNGQGALRREICILRRDLGAPRYQGGVAHVVLCRIFGLSGKIAISKAVHSFFDRLS